VASRNRTAGLHVEMRISTQPDQKPLADGVVQHLVLHG
jgi:hypothetical protein